jgi:hypothetical protein
MSATPPGYSAQFFLSIERTVTKARLSRYLTASSQDFTQAVQLYEYNVQLSEALYGILHGLEVTPLPALRRGHPCSKVLMIMHRFKQRRRPIWKPTTRVLAADFRRANSDYKNSV